MKIYLIRHGKTAANEQHLYCGSSNLSLSKLGIEELQEIKNKINEKPNCVFASALLRTQQTAEILFETKEITISPLINEINFGDFELYSYEQLKHNKSYISWINNIENSSPPNGEAKKAFTIRAVDGVKQIINLSLEKKAKKIAIVTHGGVISAVMEHFYPAQKSFYEWQPSFGNGYLLEIVNDFKIEKYCSLF